MSSRRDRDFVLDILEAIRRIRDYTQEISYVEFLGDTKTQDAVIRNPEVIGEAAKKVGPGVRKKYADVPWSIMARVRDRLIHHYFGVNFEVVWEIATGDLPRIAVELERILTDLDEA